MEWRKDDFLLDWKPRLYLATVRMYDDQTDMATLKYVSEAGKEYTMPAQRSVEEGRLKAARTDVAVSELYDQVTEHISYKDVKKAGWRSGWYRAQVQGFDPDNNTIDIVYSKEPRVIYTEDVSTAILAGSITLSKAVF